MIKEVVPGLISAAIWAGFGWLWFKFFNNIFFYDPAAFILFGVLVFIAGLLVGGVIGWSIKRNRFNKQFKLSYPEQADVLLQVYDNKTKSFRIGDPTCVTLETLGAIRDVTTDSDIQSNSTCWTLNPIWSDYVQKKRKKLEKMAEPIRKKREQTLNDPDSLSNALKQAASIALAGSTRNEVSYRNRMLRMSDFSKNKAKAVLDAFNSEKYLDVSPYENEVLASIESGEGIFLLESWKLGNLVRAGKNYSITDAWRSFLRDEYAMKTLKEVAGLEE